MEKLLQKAQISGQPVMLMYMSKKGVVTKRLVSIKRISEQSVIGYCHLRKAQRCFLKENILAALPATREEIREHMNNMQWSPYTGT